MMIVLYAVINQYDFGNGFISFFFQTQPPSQ